MQTTVTSTADVSKFGTSRGHENLNKIAEAFNRLGATNDMSFISPAKIASMVGLDRAHVTRIIDGKPGFVRVIAHTNGDRRTGYYFMADQFVPEAVKQGFSHYPHNTYPLWRNDMPTVVALSDGSVEVGKSKPADIKLEGEVGHYDPFVIEALRLDPTRMVRLFEPSYLEQAASVIRDYQVAPNSTLVPLDTLLSHLTSLRIWLATNGNDPEATLMLGAKN